jgi:hypothetical protein
MKTFSNYRAGARVEKSKCIRKLSLICRRYTDCPPQTEQLPPLFPHPLAPAWRNTDPPAKCNTTARVRMLRRGGAVTRLALAVACLVALACVREGDAFNTPFTTKKLRYRDVYFLFSLHLSIDLERWAYLRLGYRAVPVNDGRAARAQFSAASPLRRACTWAAGGCERVESSRTCFGAAKKTSRMGMDDEARPIPLRRATLLSSPACLRVFGPPLAAREKACPA